jgi:hypothetical protein
MSSSIVVFQGRSAQVQAQMLDLTFVAVMENRPVNAAVTVLTGLGNELKAQVLCTSGQFTFFFVHTAE